MVCCTLRLCCAPSIQCLDNVGINTVSVTVTVTDTDSGTGSVFTNYFSRQVCERLNGIVSHDHFVPA